MQEKQEVKFDWPIRRSRFVKKELRPFVLGDSCCHKSLLLADHEVSEVLFPVKVNRAQDCDLLIVHGVITPQMVPYIKKVISQMSAPFVVMAVGQCTLSGIFFKTIALQDIVNVDIEVTGCAPEPRELAQAIKKARDILENKLTQFSGATHEH